MLFDWFLSVIVYGGMNLICDIQENGYIHQLVSKICMIGNFKGGGGWRACGWSTPPPPPSKSARGIGFHCNIAYRILLRDLPGSEWEVYSVCTRVGGRKYANSGEIGSKLRQIPFTAWKASYRITRGWYRSPLYKYIHTSLIPLYRL